jgi:hypothetical protein
LGESNKKALYKLSLPREVIFPLREVWAPVILGEIIVSARESHFPFHMVYEPHTRAHTLVRAERIPLNEPNKKS